MPTRTQARAVLVVAVAVYALWGCSSTSRSRGGEDGGAAAHVDVDAALDDGTIDASADSSTPEADAGARGPTTLAGCGVKRAATTKACDEACGARLALPGGGAFCTVECTQDSDCAAPGADLRCPDTIGACVPRCTSDASCKAAGFLRCDAAKSSCDTI